VTAFEAVALWLWLVAAAEDTERTTAVERVGVLGVGVHRVGVQGRGAERVAPKDRSASTGAEAVSKAAAATGNG
jgi:hypothetical protein